ncbi:alpha/beta fold hydrolase [Candidatus Leptofilum sp.]|uniref:alpha/beta fold hydrolase n=1 Tax=Candidatus Leptofilum sp. TaxID=3241576 RepID=UPI003B5C830F
MATSDNLPKPPAIHYVQSGDVHIAYQIIGTGEQAVLFVNGFLSHLDVHWEDEGLARFIMQIATNRRLILFDKRGVGLSDRIGSPPTLEDTLDDMLMILDTIGCRQVVLFGVSEGAPAAALFAATYPERVEKLILYGAMVKWVREFDYPWALTRNQYNRWLEAMIENWGSPFALHTFAPSNAEDPAFQQWWGKMMRLAATPGSVRDVLGVMRDIDVRAALPHIHVATLVLHRTYDKAVRIEGARWMASQLPNAIFVELEGKDHWWWLGETEALIEAIEQFLQEEVVEDGKSRPVLLDPLTPRELDVLRLLATGYTNQQVADDLVLSVGTVKAYTSKIYNKLGVRNRTQAIAHARKLGVI